MTSKKSLSTASHNIANANTEGFSRQEVRQQTTIPVSEGNYVLGTGTEVKSIKRVHDKMVEKRLNYHLNQNQYYEERNFQLQQVENVFNEINSDGLGKILNRFFNSFRELANQPENETVRTIVRENARLVVKDFNRIKKELYQISDSVEDKAERHIEEVNSALHSIGELNKRIRLLEINGGETGDLRDQRDLAISSIAEQFQVHTYVDELGQHVVNAVGVGTLVAGNQVQELTTGRIKRPDDERGYLEIFYRSRPGHVLSEKFRGGKIGALLETRNKEIKDLENNIDFLAYNLAKSTNAIHRKGMPNREIPMGPDGRTVASESSGKEELYSGINFFEEPVSVKRAADLLALSSEVSDDVNNIVTALSPNAPGDNRIAIAISKLQHEKILSNGSSTFEEEYLKSVGSIGLLSAKSEIDAEQAKGILAQTRSVKERISGVSLDEEAANIVRFQHAYEASARVIRTADEMFDSVMEMMR